MNLLTESYAIIRGEDATPKASWPNSVTEFLQQLLTWVEAHPVWAGVLVCLIAFAESVALVGILVPGVVILFGVGALIAAGALDFWSMCGWAVAGAVAGDSFSYWLGRHYHEQLQHLWPFSRHPKMLHGGIEFFHRNGGVSVFIGRFFGPVRATIPFVAGMLEMAPSHFLAANVASALLWAPAYLLPGMALGASLEAASAVALRLVILVLGLLGSIWLVERSLRWLARRAGPTPAWVALLVLLLLPWLFGLHQPTGRIWQAVTTEAPRPVLAFDSPHWWSGDWALLPERRDGLTPHLQHRFNLQFAGRTEDLLQALAQSGWQSPKPLDAATLTRWLSPEAALTELPPLPLLHGSGFEQIMRVKAVGDDQLVLRLWPAGKLGDGTPLWLGTVDFQVRHHRLWHLISYALPTRPQEALSVLWQDLAGGKLWLRRTDGLLLLRSPPW